MSKTKTTLSDGTIVTTTTKDDGTLIREFNPPLLFKGDEWNKFYKLVNS